jgi:hypothetical protein
VSYREHFNHLGELNSADFRAADLIICSIAFVVIAALFSGVLA